MVASRKKSPSRKAKSVAKKPVAKKAASKKRKKLPFIVRNSTIHGKGVFATAPIAKGTRLIEYKGKRITEAQADEMYGDDESPHTFLFLLNNDMVIDANFGGNSARWINHCCTPNCEPIEDEDDRVYIEAKRNIKPGEELSYDYQLVIEERYTKAVKQLYACRCGSKKCRGNFLAEKD
jgi:SET domain-containing protein